MNLTKSSLRQRTQSILENSTVRYSIIGLIVLNAITLGMETSKSMMNQYGDWLHGIDNLILSIFVLELVLKLYAYGWRFFTSGWNILDFLVVSITLLPNNGALSVLRVLRILRILKLISAFPQLRLVVEALLYAIPSISSIVGLMLIVFYMFSVIATNLFGADFPDWFGNIAVSMYTLFQVMTLESWSMGISRPVMDVFPHAWIFFISFILISTFTILNLFIAIIVDGIQNIREAQQKKEQVKLNLLDEKEDLVLLELRALRQEVKDLKQALQRD